MYFFYVKVNDIRYIIQKGRAFMTIVESFERAPLNNILSALESRAEKIIFLGDPAHMEKHMVVYKKLLKMKGITTELVLKDVTHLSLDDVLELLTNIVESEASLVFDITGGDDLVLLAFGIIYERYRKTKDLKLQHFDIPTEDYPLNVKELISLYGGIVIPEEPQPTVSNAMEIVDKIWDFSRSNSSKWNRTNSFLKELEKKGNQLEDGLDFHLDFSKNKQRIESYIFKFREVAELLKKFETAGLVENFQEGPDSISYKYKNAFVMRCLEKAGDALEMKCYFEALSLMENGKPYFNDCYVSVNIDWDGIIHPLEDNWKDTTNEIDLMVMRGLTPIFISCKNGKIGEEELYKLNTVASRFGGKYAKKVLIATKLERETPAAQKSYLQRAKDMGVHVVPNAGTLSKEAWRDLFLSL